MDLSKMEALFKSFVEAHPHLVEDAGTVAEDAAQAAAVAVPGPGTFYDVLRAVVPLIPGLTGVARAEYAAAIDQHQAEHTALAKQLPGTPDEAPVPAAGNEGETT